MEGALTSFLLADLALAALVGDRIHWLRLPATVAGFPYLTLQVVSHLPDYNMDGPSGMAQSRVQADAWAETYVDAKAVERAFSAAVSGYRGTHAGVVFQGIFVNAARDLTDTTTGEERQLFRVSVDIEISWNMEI